MRDTLEAAQTREGLDASHALTSLRFFAALYVLFFHAVPVLLPPNALPQPALHLISLGYVSVSFFFLLSGYILAVAYFANRRQGISVQRFYRARFARVYPLFLFTLLFDAPDWYVAHARAFGGYLSSIPPTVGVLTIHALMLQAWIPGLRGIDRPNWSLSVETFLYLLFPLTAPLIWRLRSATAALLGLGLWVGGQAVVYIAVQYISGNAAMFLPALHLSTFLVGICLARWQSLHQKRLESATATIPILGIAVLGAATAVLFYSGRINHTYLNDGMLAPLFGCLIVVFSLNGRIPARALSNRPLRLLGESSYALYLFHFPILHYFQRLHASPNIEIYAIYLATCVAVSILSYRYFETPWRARLAPHIPEPQVLKGEPL